MGCIPVMLVTIFLLSNYAYADTPGQLGMKLFPGKIIENSQGLIQVYSKSEGGIINKLVATSSDPSIVQITSIEQDPSHTLFTVKINAVKFGEAKISLAAPGFSSGGSASPAAGSDIDCAPSHITAPFIAFAKKIPSH